VTRGSWLLADQAIVSLASFLAAAIVGRVCGREELGIYGLAVSIFWLVAGVPNSLIWTPYTSRVAKMPPQRRAFYTGSVTWHAILVAMAIAASLLAIGLVSIPLLSIVDKVLILRGGRAEAFGAPRDVLRRVAGPAKPVEPHAAAAPVPQIAQAAP
jgi:hypothetical protein